MPAALRLFALTFACFAFWHALVLALAGVVGRAFGRAAPRLRLERAGLRYALEFVATEALLLTAALRLGVVTLAPWSAPRALALLAAAFAWWEAWFYLGHRLLHTRALYPLHRPHHALAGVHPSLCFSAGETALLSAGFYVPLALASRGFGAVSAPSLALTFGLAYALNALQHLDGELFGEGHDRGPLRHALNSARYHARHHAGGRGNYGLVTPWLDRLFGTEIAQRRCGQGASRADAPDTSKHTWASR